jgi:PKHD-type hydroxylase
MHTTNKERKFKQKILTAVTVPQVLTRGQCELVIHDATKIGMKRAPVLSKDGTNVRSFTRTCDSCWVPKSPNFQWLYNYVAAVTDDVNNEHYQFDITDMQQLQVLRYRPLQKFKWHFDTYDGSDRKLTCVINLSRPEEYIGGGLCVAGDWDGVEKSTHQGSANFFPSWMKHKARAPIWGTRWALVAWITGPAWK